MQQDPFLALVAAAQAILARRGGIPALAGSDHRVITLKAAIEAARTQLRMAGGRCP